MTEFVLSDGVRVAYERAGVGDPPLIFVHGWSCNRSYFAPQFEHFAAAHAVVALDLRGHGESDQPDAGAVGYDVEALGHDVLAVVAAAGLSRPVAVGHSLGALIALECAADHDALSAVVMVDPAPITNEAVKTFFRESVAAVSADHDRSWRTAFVSGLFMSTDVTRREDIIREMPAGRPRIAGAVLRAMGDFDGVGALGRVTVPVLSIGSAVPTNASADLRAVCPTITIGQTVGAGHFNQLEVPEQVNAMIERFIAVNDLAARQAGQPVVDADTL